MERVSDTYVNGSLEHRLPGNLNISFAYVEGEAMLMALKDVAVSSGSACTSASLEPSYVLRALGVGEELAHTSIRFGIGRFNTEEEVDFVIDLVAKKVGKLRELSPLWEMAQGRHRPQERHLGGSLSEIQDQDTGQKEGKGIVMAYSDKVIEHYENPRNVGSFAKDDPRRRDRPRRRARVRRRDEAAAQDQRRGVIEDAKFKTFGCGSAIASSSLATEWVKGMTIDQAMEIKNTQIVEELNLPPVKIHCSVLAEDAIKSAIADYKTKRAARTASDNA